MRYEIDALKLNVWRFDSWEDFLNFATIYSAYLPKVFYISDYIAPNPDEPGWKERITTRFHLVNTNVSYRVDYDKGIRLSGEILNYIDECDNSLEIKLIYDGELYCANKINYKKQEMYEKFGITLNGCGNADKIMEEMNKEFKKELFYIY